jgi:hypothetical protein
MDYKADASRRILASRLKIEELEKGPRGQAATAPSRIVSATNL